MRRIILSDTESALFDEEMVPGDYEFLNRHKDTFCRMWTEQGKTFWTRYLQVFRSYVVRYSVLGDLPCELMHLVHVLDYAFDVIEKNYIEGKVNHAKGFIFQIADLGRNRHRFAYLDNKSVSKDPFYTKDTRDLFREFFGQAKEKSSYIRVYLLTPVYMRFGGSICRCLSKWKDAKEMDPMDDSYFTPPPPIKPNPSHEELNSTSVLCDHHLQDCILKFCQQFVMGNPTCPVSLDFWGTEDPRFVEQGNPLWNPDACPKSDWREGLTRQKFEEFYSWCIFSDSLSKRENQCQGCHALKKAKKKQKKKKKKITGALAESDNSEISIFADSFMSFSREGGNTSIVSHSSEIRGNSEEKQCQYADISLRFSDNLLTGSKSVSDTSRKKNQSWDQSSSHASTFTLTALSKAALAAEQGCDKSDAWKEKENMRCSMEPVCSCSPAFDDVNFGDTESAANTVKTKKSDLIEGKTSEKKTLKPQASKLKASAVTPLSQEEKQKLFGWSHLMSDQSKRTKRTQVVRMPAFGGNFGDRTVHFKVERSTNPLTNATGVWVTLNNVEMRREVKQEEDANCRKASSAPTRELGTKTYPELTSAYLCNTVTGFPPTPHCAEGSSWCTTEVDYSTVEAAKKATKFTLTICDAPNGDLAKELMIELLWYVVRRKRRPSVGWAMTEEDIFAFCQWLDERILQIKGVTFSITTHPILSDAGMPVKMDSLEGDTSVNKAQSDTSVSVKTEAVDMKTEVAITAQASHAEKVAKDLCPDVGKNSACKKRSHSHTGLSDTDTDMIGTQTSSVNKEKDGVISNPLIHMLQTSLKDLDIIKSHSAMSEKGERVPLVQAAMDNQKSPDLTGQRPDISIVSGKDSLAYMVASTTSEINTDPSQPAQEGTLSATYMDVDASVQLESGRTKKKKKRNKHKGKGQAGDEVPSDEGMTVTEDGKVGTFEAVAREQPQTYGELAQLLHATQNEGKVGPLFHTIIHPSPRPDVGGMRPIDGSGDAGCRPDPADRKLSICSNCCATEPALRAFKKCQRCKLEAVVHARYYCGRPCQVEDWKYRHSQEHATGVLR